MSKILLLVLFFCCLTTFSKKLKLNKRILEGASDTCDSNQFMIMSRQTGYSLGLAIQGIGQDGTKYYWTVTSQNANYIPNTDIWVKCNDGLKNIYSNQYLFIDGARNAVLVNDTPTNVIIDTTEYTGYNVIKRYGECLTTQDDGASYWAADYYGVLRNALYQQWNIHYI